MRFCPVLRVFRQYTGMNIEPPLPEQKEEEETSFPIPDLSSQFREPRKTQVQEFIENNWSDQE